MIFYLPRPKPAPLQIEAPKRAPATRKVAKATRNTAVGEGTRIIPVLSPKQDLTD